MLSPVELWLHALLRPMHTASTISPTHTAQHQQAQFVSATLLYTRHQHSSPINLTASQAQVIIGDDLYSNKLIDQFEGNKHHPSWPSNGNDSQLFIGFSCEKDGGETEPPHMHATISISSQGKLVGSPAISQPLPLISVPSDKMKNNDTIKDKSSAVWSDDPLNSSQSN